MTYLVKEAMRKDVLTIAGEAPLIDAAKAMVEKNVGSIIVLEKAKPVGIITEKDFVIKVVSKGLNPKKLKVKKIMTKELISVDPDTDLYEAVKLMKEHGVRRMPVIKDEILYGIIGPRELAESFTPYIDKLTKEILRTGMGLLF
ncbi:MAG: CBS domain-containing protein [Candidatus Bathyarchaeota archaeon]|nr:MAG: CBS domain-containing protein [Candidatus Bathyarchaeota archaeon]